MRGRIDRADRTVERTSDDLARYDDDRPDRHLAGGVGPGGLGERQPHPLDITVVHVLPEARHRRDRHRRSNRGSMMTPSRGLRASSRARHCSTSPE